MGPVILVINSDEDQRAILVAALGDYGYNVAEASNGEAALQMAEQLRPALIIGDFPMDVPGHSPFVEALRKEVGSKAPVLTVTARNTITALESAYAVSASVLVQPTPARVLEEVQNLLAGLDSPAQAE
jgi:CheY-like chemotaxis protein